MNGSGIRKTMVAPVQAALVFEVLAWTPDTNNVAVAPAYRMMLPARRTQTELDAYSGNIKDQVKGKLVLHRPSHEPGPANSKKL